MPSHGVEAESCARALLSGPCSDITTPYSSATPKLKHPGPVDKYVGNVSSSSTFFWQGGNSDVPSIKALAPEPTIRDVFVLRSFEAIMYGGARSGFSTYALPRSFKQQHQVFERNSSLRYVPASAVRRTTAHTTPSLAPSVRHFSTTNGKPHMNKQKTLSNHFTPPARPPDKISHLHRSDCLNGNSDKHYESAFHPDPTYRLQSRYLDLGGGRKSASVLRALRVLVVEPRAFTGAGTPPLALAWLRVRTPVGRRAEVDGKGLGGLVTAGTPRPVFRRAEARGRGSASAGGPPEPRVWLRVRIPVRWDAERGGLGMASAELGADGVAAPVDAPPEPLARLLVRTPVGLRVEGGGGLGFAAVVIATDSGEP